VILFLIKKEQYYIDNLKPEYNILKCAKSPKGLKYSSKLILGGNLARK
jgi:hypothetical protein